MAVRGSLLFSFIFGLASFIECSRITMSNGVYNNILVALHPGTDPSQCQQLIQNITEAFQYTSAQLAASTQGKARFGSLKILVPSFWDLSNCGELLENVSSAAAFESYENADFKVTGNQSYSRGKVPWTNQYKGCENESDAVYVPIDFFQNDHVDSEGKGRFLLAEWAKFRYGVFQDVAVISDHSNSTCYSIQGRVFQSACSSLRDESLYNRAKSEYNFDSDVDVLTPCDNFHAETTSKLFKNESVGVMLTPDILTMMCNDAARIGISTKIQQNLCERRSISEVVLGHRDFKHHENDGEESNWFPNTRKQRPGSSEQRNLEISIVRQDGNFNQGYAFILEDDASIRKFDRIKYVKQAMAQILQLVKPRTKIAVLRFEGSHSQPYTHFVTRVVSDLDRVQVLFKIPELETPGLSEQISARGLGRSTQVDLPENPYKKKQPFLKFLQILSGHQSDQWHLMFISSNPPGDLVETLPEISESPHTFSVLTFDGSRDWLKFNSVPNTNKVLFLPSCLQGQLNCSAKSTSLFVNYFTEILATNSSKRHHFTQKVIDFTFTGEDEAIFTIAPEHFVTGLENFQLFLPLHTADSTARLYSPSGKFCQNWKLFHYNYVVQFDTSSSTGCPYEVGDWTIKIGGAGVNGSGLTYTLVGFGETVNSESNLIVKSSFGKSLLSEVLPTLMSVPVYVLVSTEHEQPVTNAAVTLEIVHEDQNTENTNTIYLEDDGVDPDLVADDGVYSAFVTHFSSIPSFHTGVVTVKTIKGKAKSIASTVSYVKATALDHSMASKCCPSFTSVQTLNDVGTASYTTTLASFRTGEKLSPLTDIAPPSRIQSTIKIKDSATQHFITFEFTAPGSNYATGTVAHYDICCTDDTDNGILDNSLCTKLDEVGGNNCLPVAAGAVQQCTVSKSFLTTEFFNESLPISPLILLCGIRGVDEAGNSGPLSFDLIEVKMGSMVDEEPEPRATQTACNGLSDGCLQIDVFWALIGCIAGLVLILFIVVLCWCCLTRQDLKARKQKRKLTKKESNWIEALPRDSLNNVYINQAYIQDANGQLKLVASDGILHPLEGVTDISDVTNSRPNQTRPTSTNRELPNRDSDLRRKVDVDHDERRNISWIGAEEIPMSHITPPTPDSPSPMKTFPAPPRSLTSPSRQENIQHLAVHHHLGVRSSSSAEDANSNSDVDEAQPSPVYASVFRTGRKINIPRSEVVVHPTLPSDRPGYNKQRSPEFTHITSLQVNGPELSPVKDSPDEIQSQMRIRPHPPARLDHFPSSESEVYSDLSHIVHAPLRIDPVRQNHFNMRSSPLRQISRPSSSPAEMHSIPDQTLDETKTTPHHRSMEIQRPKNLRAFSPVPPSSPRPHAPPPPPPPPPRPRRHSTDSQYEEDDVPDIPVPPVKQQEREVQRYGDEDDSDTWENYEEDSSNTFRMPYIPGASYA